MYIVLFCRGGHQLIFWWWKFLVGLTTYILIMVCCLVVCCLQGVSGEWSAAPPCWWSIPQDGAGRLVLIGDPKARLTIVSWGCLIHPHFRIFGPGQCRLSMDGSPKKPASYSSASGREGRPGPPLTALFFAAEPFRRTRVMPKFSLEVSCSADKLVSIYSYLID